MGEEGGRGELQGVIQGVEQSCGYGECGSPLEYGGGGGVGAWGDSVVPEHPALATWPAVEAGAGCRWNLTGVLE